MSSASSRPPTSVGPFSWKQSSWNSKSRRCCGQQKGRRWRPPYSDRPRPRILTRLSSFAQTRRRSVAAVCPPDFRLAFESKRNVPKALERNPPRRKDHTLVLRAQNGGTASHV